MIYKVFYQKTKERNPRRETMHQMNAKDVSKHVNWLKQTQISTLNLSHHFLSNTLLTRKSQVPLN